MTWFGGLGSAGQAGTTLVTVSGAVRSPGVYEVPLGTSLAEVLTHAGASTASVLLGGYAGQWLDPNRAAKAELGSINLGCGVIFVLPEQACGLAESARVLRFTASQSAGQCGPCRQGLPAVAAAFEQLVAGDRDGRWEKQLRRWLAMVEGRGACGHPDGAVRLARSALAVFSQEVTFHRRRGPCSRSRSSSLPLPRFRSEWR